jgi:hypothetical protein
MKSNSAKFGYFIFSPITAIFNVQGNIFSTGAHFPAIKGSCNFTLPPGQGQFLDCPDAT